MKSNWVKCGVVMTALALSALPSAANAQTAPLPECSTGITEGPIKLKVAYKSYYNHVAVTIVEGAQIESLHQLKHKEVIPALFNLYYTMSPDGAINHTSKVHYMATLFVGHLLTDPGDDFLTYWDTTIELDGKTYTQQTANLDTPTNVMPMHPTQTYVTALPLIDLIGGVANNQTMKVTVKDQSNPNRYYVANVALGPLVPAIKAAKILAAQVIELEKNGQCSAE